MPDYLVSGGNGNLICPLARFFIISKQIRDILVSIAFILALEPVGSISDLICALLGIGHRANILECLVLYVKRRIETLNRTGQVTFYPTGDLILAKVALCM